MKRLALVLIALGIAWGSPVLGNEAPGPDSQAVRQAMTKAGEAGALRQIHLPEGSEDPGPFGQAFRQHQALFPNAPAFVPWTMTGAVVAWDAGAEAKAAGYVQVGGVDLVPADNDYFARTSGAIPGVTSGTPDYPLTVVAYFKTDTTASAYHILGISDGTDNERLVVYTWGTQVGFYQRGGGALGNPTASGVTEGRWHIGVFVVASNSSRAVYLDTNTTGATNATTVNTNGLNRVHVGRNWDGAAEWDGEIGPIWILSGDLSGAGNADERSLIFAGCNPVAVTGFTTLAYYPMEDASGDDASGNGFDLTPSGSPTATTKCLAIRNRISPTSPYVARATTSAPTYNATLFSNRGGAAFASAPKQFLVCESTPVTAAPFQVYAVARPTSASVNGVAFALTNSGTSNHSWIANFVGTEVGDPFKWGAIAGGSAAYASTSTGYSANTVHLVWGLEASSTSRKAEIDGGSQGTDTTSRSPSGVNRIALGIHADATPDTPYPGSIGLVLLLDTDSTAQKPDMEAWSTAEFGAP